MPRETIFVVEDEQNIQKLIQYNLSRDGYRVMAFDTGEALLDKCTEMVPDLFLVDIMLPGMDGFEVTRKLRQNAKTTTTPIIILTAKSEEFDKVLGLELGADDYVTKPFSVRELLARIKAVLRRTMPIKETEQEIIRQGSITIDDARREVHKNGHLIEMPLKEYELLKILIQNKGNVLTRDVLLEKVWGFDYFGETRTVDVHIRYLRQKIEDDPNNPVFIETVRGVGYRFNDKA